MTDQNFGDTLGSIAGLFQQFALGIGFTLKRTQFHLGVANARRFRFQAVHLGDEHRLLLTLQVDIVFKAGEDVAGCGAYLRFEIASLGLQRLEAWMAW